jgi:hypothetical protein
MTIFNRGKTPLKKITTELDSEFDERVKNTRFIIGNRLDPDVK